MIHPQRCYNVISQDSFKKIFPEQYYEKFAKHIKILNFEKKILYSKPQTYKLKFVKPQQPKISISKNHFTQIPPRNKISKFAPIEDIVQKDRQEIQRMKKIAKSVNSKLKFEPKQNKQQIKAFLGEYEMDPVVIQRMRLISKGEQDKNQDKILQQRERKRVSKKFKKPQFYQSSQIIRSYSQKSIKNMEIMKLFQTKLNPQNSQINKIRKQKEEAQTRKQRFKKNLIQDTNKIRKFGNSIQVISQFNQHQKHKISMKFLQNVLQQKNQE